MTSDYKVIMFTINEYYNDRSQEYNKLIVKYNSTSCMITRRKLRKRKEELSVILSQDIRGAKQNLMHKIFVPYKELKKYPNLIEIERKTRELKREMLWLK